MEAEFRRLIIPLRRTDLIQCPSCDSGMTLRPKRKTRGWFFGCGRYPDCRGTKTLDDGDEEAKKRISQGPRWGPEVFLASNNAAAGVKAPCPRRRSLSEGAGDRRSDEMNTVDRSRDGGKATPSFVSANEYGVFVCWP